MKLRSKIALSVTALGFALGGWAWTGSAAAVNGARPATTADEGTVTYQRAAIARPVAGADFPTAPINGLNWTSPSDLTFHPLVPCRLVDTRQINARIPNQGHYDFNAYDGTSVDQGGFDGDCGVPYAALAVELNVVSVGSTTQGYLKLYPYLAIEPNASILNYSAGQNIANTATVARCILVGGGLCDHDFTVYAHTAAHLLVDVLGYYESPLSAQLDADGTVAGASLAVEEAGTLSPGAYYVTFDRVVRNCVYSVTAGSHYEVPTGPVFVEVHQQDAGLGRTVFVNTWSSAAAPANYPFQLVVHC
ncbi:hypothetical protein BH10ACT2_BH10ACT2_25770 [soil metagenome]